MKLTRRDLFKRLAQGSAALALLPLLPKRKDPMDGKLTEFRGFRHIKRRSGTRELTAGEIDAMARRIEKSSMR